MSDETKPDPNVAAERGQVSDSADNWERSVRLADDVLDELGAPLTTKSGHRLNLGGRIKMLFDSRPQPVPPAAVSDALRRALNWRELPPLPWKSAADRQPWPNQAADSTLIVDAEGVPLFVRNWKEVCAAIQYLVLAANHCAALAHAAAPSRSSQLIEQIEKHLTQIVSGKLEQATCEGLEEEMLRAIAEFREAEAHADEREPEPMKNDERIAAENRACLEAYQLELKIGKIKPGRYGAFRAGWKAARAIEEVGKWRERL